MHDWSDENVDWDGINAAAEFIALNLVRYGRVCVRDYKEKYGSVRIYLSLGWESLYSITHPRYVYIRYKKGGFLWWLSFNKTFRWLFQKLNYVVIPYHAWLYRFLYKRAIKKWPHLTKEIMVSADFRELLKGISEEYDSWSFENRVRNIFRSIEYEREQEKKNGLTPEDK